MPNNNILAYHLDTDVSTQRTYYACLIAHININVYFTNSELCAINRCCMSKGMLFMIDVCNHQVTKLLK